MTIDPEDPNEGLLSTHFAEKTLLGIYNTPIAFLQDPDSLKLRLCKSDASVYVCLQTNFERTHHIIVAEVIVFS